MLQLEARASIAEAGKAVAQQQLAQLRQQIAAESNAHQAQVSMLTAQLAHQDAVLAGAAQYLGPLESRANPVSPVLSPRLSNAPQVSSLQCVFRSQCCYVCSFGSDCISAVLCTLQTQLRTSKYV